jgi:hypothetical protein
MCGFGENRYRIKSCYFFLHIKAGTRLRSAPAFPPRSPLVVWAKKMMISQSSMAFLGIIANTILETTSAMMKERYNEFQQVASRLQKSYEALMKLASKQNAVVASDFLQLLAAQQQVIELHAYVTATPPGAPMPIDPLLLPPSH